MILVTGSSQGIGFACVQALLARTGSRVVMTGRDAAKLAAARAAVSPEHRARLESRVCDQGNGDDVEALTAWLSASDEPVEGAILTVGGNPMYSEGPRRIHALSPATIAATIGTNCTHATLITASLLDRFRRQRGGVLVWIGSQAARVGLPGAGVYCATKSFLSGLAQAAHNEYAGRGVRVHLVHPGVVRTPRTASVVDGFAARHGQVVMEPSEAAQQIVDLFLSGDSSCVETNL